MQQLVDTRRAQAHRRRDLSHGQPSAMRRSDGDGSLQFGRLEPLGHDTQALAYLLPRLAAASQRFRGLHHFQDAKRSCHCLENWTL